MCFACSCYASCRTCVRLGDLVAWSGLKRGKRRRRKKKRKEKSKPHLEQRQLVARGERRQFVDFLKCVVQYTHRASWLFFIWWFIQMVSPPPLLFHVSPFRSAHFYVCLRVCARETLRGGATHCAQSGSEPRRGLCEIGALVSKKEEAKKKKKKKRRTEEMLWYAHFNTALLTTCTSSM